MNRPTHQQQIPRRDFESQMPYERSALQEHCSTVKRTIEENPLVATLAMFGVGLAIGTFVGGVLADGGRTHPPTLSDRIQQRIGTVLSDMLPASLERRLHG